MDAVVEITEFKVIALAGSAAEYTVSLRVAEKGGKSGVMITSVRLTVLDRQTETAVPWTTSWLLYAGTTAQILSPGIDAYGEPLFSFSDGKPVTRAAVFVTFADDGGHSGSVTAIALVDS